MSEKECDMSESRCNQSPAEDHDFRSVKLWKKGKD
jgi:hypothetical protein